MGNIVRPSGAQRSDGSRASHNTIMGEETPENRISVQEMRGKFEKLGTTDGDTSARFQMPMTAKATTLSPDKSRKNAQVWTPQGSNRDRSASLGNTEEGTSNHLSPGGMRRRFGSHSQCSQNDGQCQKSDANLKKELDPLLAPEDQLGSEPQGVQSIVKNIALFRGLNHKTRQNIHEPNSCTDENMKGTFFNHFRSRSHGSFIVRVAPKPAMNARVERSKSLYRTKEELPRNQQINDTERENIKNRAYNFLRRESRRKISETSKGSASDNSTKSVLSPSPQFKDTPIGRRIFRLKSSDSTKHNLYCDLKTYPESTSSDTVDNTTLHSSELSPDNTNSDHIDKSSQSTVPMPVPISAGLLLSSSAAKLSASMPIRPPRRLSCSHNKGPAPQPPGKPRISLSAAMQKPDYSSINVKTTDEEKKFQELNVHIRQLHELTSSIELPIFKQTSISSSTDEEISLPSNKLTPINKLGSCTHLQNEEMCIETVPSQLFTTSVIDAVDVVQSFDNCLLVSSSVNIEVGVNTKNNVELPSPKNETTTDIEPISQEVTSSFIIESLPSGPAPKKPPRTFAYDIYKSVKSGQEDSNPNDSNPSVKPELVYAKPVKKKKSTESKVDTGILVSRDNLASCKKPTIAPKPAHILFPNRRMASLDQLVDSSHGDSPPESEFQRLAHMRYSLRRPKIPPPPPPFCLEKTNYRVEPIAIQGPSRSAQNLWSRRHQDNATFVTFLPGSQTHKQRSMSDETLYKATRIDDDPIYAMPDWSKGRATKAKASKSEELHYMCSLIYPTESNNSPDSPSKMVDTVYGDTESKLAVNLPKMASIKGSATQQTVGTAAIDTDKKTLLLMLKRDLKLSYQQMQTKIKKTVNNR